MLTLCWPVFPPPAAAGAGIRGPKVGPERAGQSGLLVSGAAHRAHEIRQGHSAVVHRVGTAMVGVARPCLGRFAAALRSPIPCRRRAESPWPSPSPSPLFPLRARRRARACRRARARSPSESPERGTGRPGVSGGAWWVYSAWPSWPGLRRQSAPSRRSAPPVADSRERSRDQGLVLRPSLARSQSERGTSTALVPPGRGRSPRTFSD